MPCDDVTEIIRLRFDADERLKSYSLSKKTCGGGVGSAGLLEDYFRGRALEDILALEPADYLAQRRARGPRGGADGSGGRVEDVAGGVNDAGDLEEFLELKHFFAVQIALEVLTGRASGGIRDRCVAAGIAHDGDELYFEADIPVDLPTEKIRSCGLCQGCGSKKAGRAAGR